MPSFLLDILNNSTNTLGEYQSKSLSEVHKSPQVSTNGNKMFVYGRRDNDLFHTANCLFKGGMKEDNIFQVLVNLIKSWGEEPDPKWIDAKINSAVKRSNKRKSSLSQEVREFVNSSEGVFLSTEIHNYLHISSANDKKNISTILSRLIEEKVIERVGQRNGQFRKRNVVCEEIDFLNADTNSIDLWLPFNLHKKVEIMPGNIILIAGEPNAGKTALLLNIIKNNMWKFKIDYFNSEMGASELRKRLMNFDDIKLNEWRFKPQERSYNFSDVIKPGEDRINIIDFLEIYENFYEISGRLAEIHDKLNGAIAIIAIQKNKGIDVGIGGHRTLEKPRLALAISPGKLKIVKAKNWKTNENPNGKQIYFNIVSGCKLYSKGDWHLDNNN